MYCNKFSFKLRRPIKVGTQIIERVVDAVEDSFVINKYGHIRSDFAVLTDTCEANEFASMLSKMQAAYQDNSSQFDGMTFEEMITSIRPRWCQLPGEQDRFEQYLIDNALDFYKRLRAQEEQKLEDDEQHVTPPAKLAPAASSSSE